MSKARNIVNDLRNIEGLDAPAQEQLVSGVNIKTVNGTSVLGGDSSASAIAGAVQLAQSLGEAEVKLWGINNNISTYTFEEAMNISAKIAKAYRDTQLAKYEKIQEVNACTTIEELELLGV